MDFLKDYNRLIKESFDALNTERDYTKAYKKAVQANLIAEEYLKDEYKKIESMLYQGLAHVNIDSMHGHDLLQNLYINNDDFLKTNEKMNLLVKTAYARAKRTIGEYDDAIRLFKEILEYVKKKNRILKNNIPASLKKGLISCLIDVNFCQISQYRYESSLKKLENIVHNTQNEEEILKELKFLVQNKNEESELLQEAKKLAEDSLEIAKANDLESYEAIALTNIACVMIERGEIEKAKDILEKVLENDYANENFLGNILNEIALINILEKDMESAKENSDRAWHWLMIRKDEEEIVRNCFIQALYYVHFEKYEMAYACADFGFSRNQDMRCLEILYLISNYKLLEAKRKGHEAEYIEYQYNQQKYKNILTKERVK